MQKIVDSSLTLAEALAQNPAHEGDPALFHQQGLMHVEYRGFDQRLHSGQLVIAQHVMGEVEAFFKHALEISFPLDRVVPAADPRYQWDDEKLMADNVSSGFNYRPVAGTKQISKHGLGLAFDINPRQNPYVRYVGEETIVRPDDAVWSPAEPGTLSADHPLVRMMEGFGWEWGGNWQPESGRTDYQHFEKVM